MKQVHFLLIGKDQTEVDMKRKAAVFDDIIFPGGKRKAFTASYDDGTIHDRRLIEIFDKYGVKGTFNLNSGFLGLERKGRFDISVIDESEVKELYKNHEVAGHGYNHSSPTDIGTSMFMHETIVDKENLELLTGKLVRGYAYPFGKANETVEEILKLAGYHYARLVDTTGAFEIPENFLEWKGTCHHKDAKMMELAEEFVKEGRFSIGKKLFYVWGHSYEFAGDDNWDVIENLCSFMSEHKDQIWFATNSEIYDYVTAFRNLEYSADGQMIYNPSGLTVMVGRGGKVYEIKPLETVVME